MKRSWNWAVWTGASLVFLGVISYPLFSRSLPQRFAIFPWVNLPMIRAPGWCCSPWGLCAHSGVRTCFAAKFSAVSSRC